MLSALSSRSVEDWSGDDLLLRWICMPFTFEYGQSNREPYERPHLGVDDGGLFSGRHSGEGICWQVILGGDSAQLGWRFK